MESRTGFFRKPFFYILFTLFIIWIILFEFVLPENNILPRPGIVLISIPALFEDYNFLAHFFTTISAIYLPAVLAYIFIFFIREYILSEKGFLNQFIEFISNISVFIPAVLLAAITVYWFPHTFVAEYIFSFVISVSWWIVTVNAAKKKQNENYLITFKSFGAGGSFLNKNILWNEIKPEVFKNLFRFHLHLWVVIIFYEFLAEGYGLGTILQKTLAYHDLSALTLIAVIISVIILGGFFFLKYLEDKFIFWETE
jgi:ABC-type nitrate/sulfonate/bicarbonate transport system permease component